MLADSAQISNGKLYVLGGCIDRIPQNSPFAFAGYVLVPWDQTNRRHELTIGLFTADGNPVSIATQLGMQVFTFVAEFEVGRPPGVAAGTQFTMPIAAQLPPLGVPPGRYEFRCSLPGQLNAQTLVLDVTPA
jgi:hypothetical protein